VPPQLMEILRRCLQKNPAARFQDIREVRALLAATGTDPAAGPVEA
jgi:hypothetical protein